MAHIKADTQGFKNLQMFISISYNFILVGDAIQLESNNLPICREDF